MNYYFEVLKKYAVFKGRARRSEFWYYTLFYIIVSIILSIISSMMGDKKGIIGIVYSLGLFIPGLAVGVRRLHDIGKSGWMILINLIPLIGFIWFIVLATKDSDPLENKYGPNPKMAPVATPAQPQV